MSVQGQIPLGTQVVLQAAPDELGSPRVQRGTTGRIVRENGIGYAVALVDGQLVDVRGEQLLAVRQPAPPRAAPTSSSSSLVPDRVIYAAAVGSTGDERSREKLDGESGIRAVYQAPTSAFWSLSKPPKHVAGPGPAWFSWEIERFCELAVKANPTCLELLWSPLPVWVGDAGRELLDLRGAFLSQSIARAYSSYVLAQFKKLEENDRQHEQQRWSHVAHLLRLLMDGDALLRTGDVVRPVGELRERLLAVGSGQVSWNQVETWRLELQQRLDAASSSTFLPAAPDVERVDAWLADLRRRDVDGEPA